MSLTYSQLNQLNLIKLRVSYVCSSCFLFRPSSKNILLLLAIQEYDIVPLIYIYIFFENPTNYNFLCFWFSFERCVATVLLLPAFRLFLEITHKLAFEQIKGVEHSELKLALGFRSPCGKLYKCLFHYSSVGGGGGCFITLL